MEAAGLALAIVATVDLCLKYGNILVDICATFRNAEVQIDERILHVRSYWKRTSLQLDFLKQTWQSLDKEHQTIQSEILDVLVGKLKAAISKLSRLEKPQDSSIQGQVTQVKRWKFVFVKENLDKVIKDLDLWQQIFDPSWFLIMRLTDPVIDMELKKHQLGKRDCDASIRINASVFRNAAKDESVQMQSVFLPKDGLKDAQIHAIPHSSAMYVQRAGAASFDLVFNIPQELRHKPTSLRSILGSRVSHTLTERIVLAKQLARSISYIHTLGFVHKNVRPETILGFNTQESTFGPFFLVGLEKLRMADGRTLQQGDLAWEQNLYRHPDRQGLKPEEIYTMQHDIYSLGVCLLEIGLWDSFVIYPHSGTLHTPNGVLGLHLGGSEFSAPRLMKDYLVALAINKLPGVIGDLYKEVVVNCLTCLDKDNLDFGDETEFQDADGVLVGVRYIEKVCHLRKSIECFRLTKVQVLLKLDSINAKFSPTLVATSDAELRDTLE
nr:hypothetical protein CFP56_10983 [Quercus suber]